MLVSNLANILKVNLAHFDFQLYPTYIIYRDGNEMSLIRNSPISNSFVPI